MISFGIKYLDVNDRIMKRLPNFDLAGLLSTSVVLFFLNGLIAPSLTAQSGSPEDIDFYELIEASKENFSKEQNISKAFAEVETYYKDTRIELSQFFYNLERRGFIVEDLVVKQSRVGARPFSDIIYTSLNFAEKIFRYKDDVESWELPNSPLRLSKRKLKRLYELELDRDYKPQGKSVVSVNFKPKKNNRDYFNGRIWLDYENNKVLRIQYLCDDCKRTPFQMLNDLGVSMRVSMDIAKEFESDNDKQQLSDMQFNYSIELLDDLDSSEENFVLEGKGKLDVYSQLDSFYIPRYSWFENELDNTFRSVVNPLDSALWYGNEYKTLNPDHTADETFFAQSDVISNVYGSQSLSGRIGRVFNIPSISWSPEGRKNFSAYISNIVYSETNSYNFNGLDYLPVVHLYMNVNETEGVFDYNTSTIFDPVNSYFSLPKDTASVCYLSMFFDLTEIMRRKLEVRLARANDSFLSYEYIYNSFMYDLSEIQNDFLDEVKEGTNEQAMKKWNDYIKQYLDIDNLLEYNLYQDD